jgi:hypothetical protein
VRRGGDAHAVADKAIAVVARHILAGHTGASTRTGTSRRRGTEGGHRREVRWERKKGIAWTANGWCSLLLLITSNSPVRKTKTLQFFLHLSF